MALSLALVLAFAIPARPDERVDRWRADVEFLGRELAARHLNLFHDLPREEWEARVAELAERIPELEDQEIAADVARLVASAGDAHTTVHAGSPPFVARAAPIELRWFPDGLRLVAAPSEKADAVGGRVVKIGGVAIVEAWERASELISHENEAWLRAQVPRWLAMPPFLHAIGLADDDANARYTVEPDAAAAKTPEATVGGTIDVDVRAGTVVRSFARAEPAQTPLWLERRREPYWFEYLAESGTLFLQYNQCADDPGKPFFELAQELFAVADREKPQRLVIDVRHNGGGNSLVIQPLYAGLASRRELRARGRLFVAIGPQTFSSGMMNAVELRQGCGALLVGEPTGGKPNSYGEVKTLELPNSRLRIGYCTKLFKLSATDAPSVEPDVAAPVTIEDWKRGRDPALEAVVRWKE